MNLAILAIVTALNAPFVLAGGGGGGSDQPRLHCASKELGFILSIDNLRRDPLRIGHEASFFPRQGEYRKLVITKLDAVRMELLAPANRVEKQVRVEIDFALHSGEARFVRVLEGEESSEARDIRCTFV